MRTNTTSLLRVHAIHTVHRTHTNVSCMNIHYNIFFNWKHCMKVYWIKDKFYLYDLARNPVWGLIFLNYWPLWWMQDVQLWAPSNSKHVISKQTNMSYTFRALPSYAYLVWTKLLSIFQRVWWVSCKVRWLSNDEVQRAVLQSTEKAELAFLPCLIN
jgi:hypothetical protein